MARTVWVSNEDISHTKLNAGLDEIYGWQDNVNANSKNLSGVATLTAAAASITSSLTTPIANLDGTGQPAQGWYSTDGTTNRKRGRIVYDGGGSITGGGWVFQRLTDAAVFDANLLVLTQQHGRVGIGQSTPLGPLDVSGLGEPVSSGTNQSLMARFKASAAVTNSAILFDTNPSAGQNIRGFSIGYQSADFRVTRFHTDLTTATSDDFIVYATGRIGIPQNLTTYADNAAAVAGGLTQGIVYWDTSGNLKRVL